MEIKLGSHVNVSAKNKYLEGAILDSLSYGATAMMVYTGAPQSTRRTDLEKMHIDVYKKIMKEHNFDNHNVIIHAPYIINLASPKPELIESTIRFLKSELKRSEAFGAKYMVLHPGNHVGQGPEIAITKIAKGLDRVFEGDDTNVIITLETMAGKGTEIGRNFQELKSIINQCSFPDRLGVCLDTCHINDAGYDVSDFDKILDEFDNIIGLDKLNVIHLNDSKNPKGAKKDRHENIGYGTIGFDSLYKIVHNPRIANITKILESPHVEDKPPYKDEIQVLKSGNWYNFKNNY